MNYVQLKLPSNISSLVYSVESVALNCKYWMINNQWKYWLKMNNIWRRCLRLDWKWRGRTSKGSLARLAWFEFRWWCWRQRQWKWKWQWFFMQPIKLFMLSDTFLYKANQSRRSALSWYLISGALLPIRAF